MEMKSLKLGYVMLLLGATIIFLAFLKVLALATFSFIPDTGINIQLLVKEGDMFSLSKAKKHLFSSEYVCGVINYF